MATESMVAGLFQDPQQYQQEMLQQQMKQNYDIAGLSPEQQVTGGLRTAGYQLGGAVGGLMGAEDPQMRLMTLRKQVLQGLDPTDAAGITKAAQALAQAGDQQGAMQLAQKALEVRNTESQIAGRTEEKQAQREMQLQLAREKIQAQAEAAREKNQTAKEIAADRNAIMAQIAQMNNALKNSNSDVQRQLIETRIQDLQSKADEKQATLQSQAQGRIAAFDSALDTLETVAKHPGKKDVVGAVTGSVRAMIPGTDAAGFKAQLETFKAQTFIPMVATLKGMGALSDAEGKKLTAAVGALDPSMKQSEFDKQVTKIKADLEDARKRALQMPGAPKQPTTTNAPPAKVVKFSDLP
jgi:DNA repair exonuclease SbcCD ATPase subunit